MEQFDLDGTPIGSSYEAATNDCRTLTDDFNESLDVANEVLLGVVEPLRNCTVTEPLLAPLDEILKDIYDLKTITSSPVMNHEIYSDSSHVMLLNPSNSMSLSYGNYLNNNQTYNIPPNTNYEINYLTSPNGGNSLVGQTTMQTPISMSVPMSISMPISMPIPMQMPISMPITNAIVENISEEDNDPSPVYLNFNIDSMTPENVQNFPKDLLEIAVTDKEELDKSNILSENLKYVEYINENGETEKTEFIDNTNENDNCESNEYQENVLNTLNLPRIIENRIEETEETSGCSKFIYSDAFDNDLKTNICTNEICENNCYIMPADCNQNNDTNINPIWANVIPKEETITELEVITCRPLHTKRSIQNNSQAPALECNPEINDATDVPVNVNFITVFDTSNIKIPIITNRPKVGKKRRKQDLKIRDCEDSVFFEDLKFNKIDDVISNIEKKNENELYLDQINAKDDNLTTYEENFQSKHKKKNNNVKTSDTSDNIDWLDDDCDYKFLDEDLIINQRKSEPSTSRDSCKIKNSKRIKKNHNIESDKQINEILRDDDDSSDSELENFTFAKKCLKCPKCKKLFKTPRSLAIHQKRCDVQIETENDIDEVTMVEYLESEKEFDDDIQSFNEIPSASEEVVSVKEIDIPECKSINKIDSVEPINTIFDSLKMIKIKSNNLKISTKNKIESNNNLEISTKNKVDEIEEENPLRRVTRSQTILKALKSLPEKKIENKPIRGQNKRPSTATIGKTISNKTRSSRRKKNK